jgi:hypothetical protein
VERFKNPACPAINGYDIPAWASWIAFLIAPGLSFLGFRAAGRN